MSWRGPIIKINSILVQESGMPAKPNPNAANICPINQSAFKSESRDQYVNMGIRVLHTEMRSERSASRR